MFSQLKGYLNSISSFNTEEEWEALQQRLTVKHVKKGDSLLEAGEICSEIYFVKIGLLRIFYTLHDKVLTSKFFTENEFASAYESFLTRKPSEQAIDALEDCELLSISFQDLQYLYQKFPVFERLGRLVAEDLFIYLCHLNKKVLLTPDERYHDFLQSYPHLVQRVPQYVIASYLGITPETLSRIRKRIHLDSNQEKLATLAS